VARSKLVHLHEVSALLNTTNCFASKKNLQQALSMLAALHFHGLRINRR
jgi:hypothetical protein